MSKKLISISQLVFALGALTAASYVFAGGMQPATSVVLVSEGQGEHSMNVKNTDATPSLLYTSLENIAEDPEKLLIVTPPVTRVEGGDTQRVRFILQNKEPLKYQRLMRVYFEGIPLNKSKTPNSVGVTIRQNLPVIISPKGLADDAEPWKHLKMAICDGKLRVTNDSPYVVRLAQQGTLQPSASPIAFPKSYLLPQTKLDLNIKSANNASTVRIHPASVYDHASEDDTTEAPASNNLLTHVVGPISTWAAKPAVDASQEASTQPGADSSCYDFKAAYPQTEIDLRPGKQEVHLTVPQEALKPFEKDFSSFSTGGGGWLAQL